MRHKKKFNHLGRQRGHRHAMLANMAASLIIHKRIKTTNAKAKALKSYVEPLITKAKNDTTHSRRQVFSYLQDKEATNEMFREVSVKVGDRPGGYTRIIKLGKRLGDAADMCIIELVDYNETMLSDKAASKSSRRRRGGSKKKVETTETSTVDTAVAEAPAEEVPEVEADPATDAVVAEEEKVEEAPVVEEEIKAETPVVEEEIKAETPVVEEEVKAEAPAAEEKTDESPADKPEAKTEDTPADETEEKKEE